MLSSATKPAFKGWGGGKPGGRVWQPHPNVKRALCRNKEKEEHGGFGHKFFHHHALFVGYKVTNTLYNAIKAGIGIWGLAPRKQFTNALSTTLETAPSRAYTGMSEEPFG